MSHVSLGEELVKQVGHVRLQRSVISNINVQLWLSKKLHPLSPHPPLAPGPDR